MEHSVHAIFASHRSLEDIQSWMLVYFWKTPRDNRAWTYVGLVSAAASVCKTFAEMLCRYVGRHWRLALIGCPLPILREAVSRSKDNAETSSGHGCWPS